MTNWELAEETRKALEEFQRLPPEEQIRRLVAYGTINEQGEVLMGRSPTSDVPAEVGKGQEDRRTKKQSTPGE